MKRLILAPLQAGSPLPAPVFTPVQPPVAATRVAAPDLLLRKIAFEYIQALKATFYLIEQEHAHSTDAGTGNEVPVMHAQQPFSKTHVR